MIAEPINTALGHPAWKSTLKINGTLDRAVRHPQWIRRRLAAADLLADGFLQVDDRARFVHGGKLARRPPGGERLFASRHQRLEPAADFLDVGAGVEGGDAEVAFAGGAETGAGSDDDLSLA